MNSCNKPEEGYDHFKSFDYYLMEGVSKVEPPLNTPYVAVKKTEKEATIKLFSQCGDTLIQNFKKMDGYWYGYSKNEPNSQKVDNLKKEKLRFEDHFYIFNDTILKYRFTQILNDPTQFIPTSVSLMTPKRELVFASKKITHSQIFNVEDLIAGSFQLNGNYTITKRDIKEDILKIIVERVFEDSSKNHTSVSEYKLNGIDPIFMDDKCNNKIDQLRYERLYENGTD